MNYRKVPYDKLLAAGEKAVAKMRVEADKEGVASFIFGWAPTVDGDVLPAQPFDPQAPVQSKDIPVMIGLPCTSLPQALTSRLCGA